MTTPRMTGGIESMNRKNGTFSVRYCSCQLLLSSAECSTNINVADSANDCHRDSPEDAQKPHKCSREDVQDACLRGGLDSVLPNLIMQH